MRQQAPSAIDLSRTPEAAVPEQEQHELGVFIGRQPILDRQQRVFGYELLFRSGRVNACTAVDGDEATKSTVNNTLNVFGLCELVAGRRAFINMTRELLLDEFYSILPAGETVVELLETVEPDVEVCAACRKLKQSGYTLALDDFVFHKEYRALLDIADLVKIDISQVSFERAAALIDASSCRIRFVAERVETREQFTAASAAGYSLFQGYFFAKPEIIEGRDIPASKQNYLLLLREVSRPTLDIKSIERVMRAEPSLSIKLLRYINSASLGIRNKVNSIRQAMLLLGERYFRKWSSLVAATSLSHGAPDELIRNCLARAEFCDQIREDVRVSSQTIDLFLFGLISGLDAILRAPLEKVIEDLPLADELRAALLGEEGRLRDLFCLFVALERVETETAVSLAMRLGLEEARMLEAHEAALRFADSALRG